IRHSQVTTYLRGHYIPIESRRGLSRILKSLPCLYLLDSESAALKEDRSP
ncbi:hypothetical protein IWW34DRAFT_673510, partial [Fusarium oxysporum f. sp. albedinis]